MPVAKAAGGLTTLCRFDSRDRKGGVLTPPQNGPQPSVRLAPRAACSNRLRGARDGGIIRSVGNGGVKTPPFPVRGEKFRLGAVPATNHPLPLLNQGGEKEAAGHFSLFLVLQKAAGAIGFLGVHRIRAMVDVLDHPILVDHEGGSVGKQAGEIEDTVSFCRRLLGVAEDGEGCANRPCELPVAFRPVDADPQDLCTGLLKLGDISLIRLEFFRSTRRARP